MNILSNQFTFDEFVCIYCGTSHKISYYAQKMLLENKEVRYMCECNEETQFRFFSHEQNSIASH